MCDEVIGVESERERKWKQNEGVVAGGRDDISGERWGRRAGAPLDGHDVPEGGNEVRSGRMSLVVGVTGDRI